MGLYVGLVVYTALGAKVSYSIAKTVLLEGKNRHVTLFSTVFLKNIGYKFSKGLSSVTLRLENVADK